jgi:hypothetical protein
MTMPEYTETIEQFKERRITEMLELHGKQARGDDGVDRAEVEGMFDLEYWLTQWWTQAVLPAARRGEAISAEVLDALAISNRRHLAHDYAASIPRGYVLPEFR